MANINLALTADTWGAMGEWAGALATFGAVVVALSIARRDGRQREKDQARPLILPTADPAVVDLDGRPTAMLPGEWQTLRVAIRNAGRGPALFVRTLLDPANQSPDLWSLGALAPGDAQTLTFTHHMFDRSYPRCQMLLDYRDMAGRGYSTSVTIEVVEGAPRFYDVRTFEDHSVTPHGDAVYPQAGLRDVRPREEQPRRGWRSRIGEALRALRG